MPMDEYDMPHSISFNKILNLYSNNLLDDEINKYIEEELNYIKDIKHINYDIFKENLIKDINSNINILKSALKVLDYRYFTSISIRMVSYKTYTIKGVIIWNCITLNRGFKYKTYDEDLEK